MKEKTKNREKESEYITITVDQKDYNNEITEEIIKKAIEEL